MKKQYCVYLDVELVQSVRDKINNLSEAFNEYLAGVAYSNEERDKNKDTILRDIEEIKNTISEANIKMQIKKMELKVIEEKEIEEKEEIKRKEQFKRWICPACLKKSPPVKVLNFMEQLACSSCQMKTRDSKYTTFEYLEVEQ